MSNFLPAESSFGVRWQAFVSEAVDTSLVSVGVWEVWTVNHAPRRGASALLLFALPFLLFQVTPPRGGQLFGAQDAPATLCVSSHAPARGATAGTLEQAADGIVFQVMPPRGGQLFKASNGFTGIEVSSHAPARGATKERIAIPRRPTSFKSRPREGGNATGRTLHQSQSHSFKSCPREGGNQHSAATRRPVRGFKSCPREGGNIIFRPDSVPVESVSSHAPARGATVFVHLEHDINSGVSSHAPARGATT